MTASVPTFNGPAFYVRKLVAAGHKVGVVRQSETAASRKGTGGSSSAPFARELSATTGSRAIRPPPSSSPCARPRP